MAVAARRELWLCVWISDHASKHRMQNDLLGAKSRSRVYVSPHHVFSCGVAARVDLWRRKHEREPDAPSLSLSWSEAA